MSKTRDIGDAGTVGEDTRAAGRPLAPDHLELPRPWRLMLTAGWNLAESLGLPVAGYLTGAALAGPNAGMVAATAVVWLTVAVRKMAARGLPRLLIISALVLTLQTAVVLITGSELFFLLQFPLANLALCVLFAWTAPTRKPLVLRLFGSKLVLDSVQNPLLVVSRAHICLPVPRPGLIPGRPRWRRCASAANRCRGLPQAGPGDPGHLYIEPPCKDRTQASPRSTIFGAPSHYAGPLRGAM